MNKKVIIGVSYVSLWVIVWGSVASIIDLPLLTSHVYMEGDLGQYATFSLSGALSVILAVNFYPTISKLPFIDSFTNKNTEN